LLPAVSLLGAEISLIGSVGKLHCNALKSLQPGVPAFAKSARFKQNSLYFLGYQGIWMLRSVRIGLRPQPRSQSLGIAFIQERAGALLRDLDQITQRMSETAAFR
jgi:hypothetical protein